MEVQLNYTERKKKSKKVMLWLGMISMAMVFAGLTSAYIVSSSRPDWLASLQMPSAFYVSSTLIFISSFTFHMAKLSVKRGDYKRTSLLTLSTLILGVGFVIFQFRGFSEIIDMGYFFTGASSNITTSFIYVMAVTHLAHLFFGLISLIVVIYNNYKQKYDAQNLLGFELALIFWHFLDFIWLYLFLFFVFIG